MLELFLLSQGAVKMNNKLTDLHWGRISSLAEEAVLADYGTAHDEM